MAGNDDERGRASGYSVDEEPGGGFRWRAFGPLGTLEGHSESREEAEGAARAAERELTRTQGGTA